MLYALIYVYVPGHAQVSRERDWLYFAIAHHSMYLNIWIWDSRPSI